MCSILNIEFSEKIQKLIQFLESLSWESEWQSDCNPWMSKMPVTQHRGICSQKMANRPYTDKDDDLTQKAVPFLEGAGVPRSPPPRAKVTNKFVCTFV
jgi:hypothetical protein